MRNRTSLRRGDPSWWSRAARFTSARREKARKGRLGGRASSRGSRSGGSGGHLAAGSSALAAVLGYAPPAFAQAADSVPDLLARPVSLVLVLAIVALLPFAFMTLTSFVKISTVLQIVRGAIGAQNVPSNMVVTALAFALTLLAMAPVGSRIAERLEPVLTSDRVEATTELARDLIAAVGEPLKAFLVANASDRERGRFFEIARSARPEDERARVGRDDLTVVIPAFVVTELLEAFALGFALYLPFLVIDLVVSNVLLALGMQMTNPTQVSLPFKLLLFVALDGWGLLAQALVAGYDPG